MEPAVPWKKTIEVLGATEKMARDEVWDQVSTLLAHDLDLSTLPSRDFLSEKLKLNRKNESVTPGPEIDGVKTVQVHMDLELTPEGWRQLAAFERSWLARERTEFAFRALAIVTILLGAVAGYIRLDEWTKGYYTGRLRILAVVIVAVAAVVIARPL
jgi:hypothetical protein